MSTEKLIQIGICACLLLCAMVHPALAQATGVTSLETGAQAILNMLTGTTAKIFATIAVIGVGLSCLTGRLDLRHAFFVVIGIGIIFGAAQIASMLTGS